MATAASAATVDFELHPSIGHRQGERAKGGGRAGQGQGVWRRQSPGCLVAWASTGKYIELKTLKHIQLNLKKPATQCQSRAILNLLNDAEQVKGGGWMCEKRGLLVLGGAHTCQCASCGRGTVGSGLTFQ